MEINGIIIADKPAGWTSHDVVAKLRGVLREKRIGHGGTLDPMATGVLPIFIGRATAAAEFCENAEKEYIAGLRLGYVTDTQDITGNIISTCETSVDTSELSAVLSRFLGSQKQIPPMYSAIKQNGQKLYDLARRGIEVPRPAREITVFDIELLDGGENDYLLRIACSKGTYIRTLCHDIGQTLGCGGVMSSLRRTGAGAFHISMAKTLSVIQAAASSGNLDEIIMKTDSMFPEYQPATLNQMDTAKIKHGAQLRARDMADGRYRFYGPDNEFLALAELVSGEVRVIKRFFAIGSAK